MNTTMDPFVVAVDLPSEILKEILLRIPAKDLVRLKKVCKHWCSLISDRNFAKAHVARLQPCLVFTKSNQYSHRCYVLNPTKLGDSNTEGVEELTLKYEGNTGLRWENSYRGLFLLSKLNDDGTEDLYIYNPVTGRSEALAAIPPKYNLADQWRWALVYDPCLEKYKVFGTSEYCIEESAIFTRVFVVTLGAQTTQWREMDSILTPLYKCRLSDFVVTYKNLRWLERFIESQRHIYSIDIVQEKLSFTQVPSYVPDWCDHLEEIEGSLCLMSKTNCSSNTFEVWLLQDTENNQWSRIYKAAVGWGNFSTLLYQENSVIFYQHEKDELRQAEVPICGKDILVVPLSNLDGDLDHIYHSHFDSLLDWD